MKETNSYGSACYSVVIGNNYGIITYVCNQSWYCIGNGMIISNITNNTISWYYEVLVSFNASKGSVNTLNDERAQFNQKGYTYHYVAIG